MEINVRDPKSLEREEGCQSVISALGNPCERLCFGWQDVG